MNTPKITTTHPNPITLSREERHLAQMIFTRQMAQPGAVEETVRAYVDAIFSVPFTASFE